MRQAGEPSVEEILESIKKVIARDNRAEAEQVRRRRDHAGVAERPQRAAPVEAYAAEEPAPVLELTDAEMAPMADDHGYDEAGQADFEATGMADNDFDGSSLPTDEPLLAETARSSVRESLTALAMLAEPGARPQIVRSGETSLEGLTRELLRPILAEWLEKNLPGMVDRLVAAEISRIVGKRG
jgi:cell pole-organizing protein PopZ